MDMLQGLMAYLDIILKNGTVILPLSGDLPLQLGSTQVDIGIKDGKILKISSSASEFHSLVSKDTEIIDCSHLHILPGVIDSQVHFREPGLTHKEDLETGTRSALLGGVTSIFEMPNTSPATTSTKLLQDKFLRAKERSHVNYAFYGGGSKDNLDQLIPMEETPGCPGIKIFMGSSTGSMLVEDDASIENILRHCKRRLVAHCEDEFRLRQRKEMAVKGKDPSYHPVWRDPECSFLAVRRLIQLARKVANHKVHILHVTTKDEVEFLSQHSDIATVEVLPQHLTFSAPECYERLGTFAQQNPPIREKIHKDALWQALRNGRVNVIGSDHAPHTREEKYLEYPQSPSGMPGVQTLVPIMLDHVNKNNLSMEDFVRLVCENPRKIFGIESKGRIAIGEDADFTIVDLQRKMTIHNSWIASRCGWTPYDGMQVKGWVHSVILNGTRAMQEDSILVSPSGKTLNFGEPSWIPQKP